MFCEGERLALVKSFRNLGVTLQTSGITYTHHLKEKVLLAIVVMNKIKEPSHISLEMTMKLSKWKITPVICAGNDTAPSNRKIHGHDLNAMFLKKVLCLSRYTHTFTPGTYPCLGTVLYLGPQIPATAPIYKRFQKTEEANQE
jgi:hypothetical protein